MWECIQAVWSWKALESSQIKSRTTIQTESQTDGDVDSKGRNLRCQRRPSAFQRALYHFRLSQSQPVQNWQTWQTTPPDPFPQSLSLHDQYPMIYQAELPRMQPRMLLWIRKKKSHLKRQVNLPSYGKKVHLSREEH